MATTGEWGEAFFYLRAPRGRTRGHAYCRDFRPLADFKTVKNAKAVMHVRGDVEGSKCANKHDGAVGVLGALHIRPVVILRLAATAPSFCPSSSTPRPRIAGRVPASSRKCRARLPPSRPWSLPLAHS